MVADAVIEKKNRLSYIDIARGFATLTVALIHVIKYTSFPWKLMMAFNIPFFFFISGMLTRDTSIVQGGFRTYLVRTAKGLLVPALLVRLMMYVILKESDLSDYLLHPHTEWFVPALFVARIALFWYVRLESLIPGKESKNLFAILTMACLVYGAICFLNAGYHFRPTWFPAELDASAVGTAFVIAGFCFRNVDFQAMAAATTKKHAAMLGSVFLLLCLLIYFNGYTSICDVQFGKSDLFFVVAGCCLSILLILASAHLEALPPKIHGMLRPFFRFLKLMGRNSLLFYSGHLILYQRLSSFLYENWQIVVEPMHIITYKYVLLYVSAALLLLTPLAAVKEVVARTLKKRGVDYIFVQFFLIGLCLAHIVASWL